jgi:hypothetical protein
MLPILIPAIIKPHKSIRDITAIQPFNCGGGLDNHEFNCGTGRVQQNYPAILEIISPFNIRFCPDRRYGVLTPLVMVA